MPPLAIAHRGLWWPDRAAHNTPRSFEAAARAGFGLELDICLVNGRLWIAHARADVLTGWTDATPLGILPALCAAPFLAWNLKDLQVPPALAEFLEKQGLLARSVVFDHELLAPGEEVATRNKLAALGFPFLMRASDRPGEELPIALGPPGSKGVWLDAFEEDWVTADTIRTVHAAGKAAYVVSPELHGRPLDLGLWKAWAGADGICTDFPHLLHALQSGGPLEPVEPWWGP